MLLYQRASILYSNLSEKYVSYCNNQSLSIRKDVVRSREMS